MKLASAIILGIVVAIFGFWLLFVRAPGPQQVCTHIMDVTLHEAGEQAMAQETQADIVERMQQQCIQHKLDKIQLRGRLKYAEYAKCVMAAQTLAEIERC
jgi:hypothetical protein